MLWKFMSDCRTQRHSPDWQNGNVSGFQSENPGSIQESTPWKIYMSCLYHPSLAPADFRQLVIRPGLAQL